MINNRLDELKKELTAGEAQLAQLDRRRAELRDTLLRISGAIQVLRELQEEERSEALANGTHTGLTSVVES